MYKKKKAHEKSLMCPHTADLVFAPTLACWRVRS